MFVIKPNQSVLWPVQVNVPVDGGGIVEQKINARFLLLTNSEYEDLIKSGEKAVLERVVVGWEGVGDEGGNALEFSNDTRDTLLNIPYVRSALFWSYVKALNGAAAKN